VEELLDDTRPVGCWFSFCFMCSFSALTLLVGHLTRENSSPIWPITCLVGR